MTRVRTSLGTLIAIAVLIGVAGVWLDRGGVRYDGLPEEPDRLRTVKLRVLVDPKRRVAVRWVVGGKGDYLVTTTHKWEHTEKAVPKGSVIALEVKQRVNGDYVHCAIDVDGIQRQFHQRLHNGVCNVAWLVGADK